MAVEQQIAYVDGVPQMAETDAYLGKLRHEFEANRDEMLAWITRRVAKITAPPMLWRSLFVALDMRSPRKGPARWCVVGVPHGGIWAGDLT